MKKKGMGRLFAGFLAGTLLMGLLAGCGGASDKMSDMAWNGSMTAAQGVSSESAKSSGYDEGMWSGGTAEEYYEADQNMDSSGTGKIDKGDTSSSKRKLIKTVNMNVETQEYDALMANLERKIDELGGYIENLESYNGSNYSGQTRRNASMTIRIPQENLDGFVSAVSDLANIVRRTENVEDITLDYVDLKSHKESLQVEQERLLELLERAETLEDIITLENRLTSVRYQIESMESQLRTYDDKVDYSTVTLRIDEVQVYTPTREDTSWERMVNGLMESLENIRDGAVNFGIWFVIHSPYLLIWGVIIAVIVIVIRRKIRKKKAKKMELASKKNGMETAEAPFGSGTQSQENK